MSRKVPDIVAKQSFLNRTGVIPLTSIFTPTEEGDFRVSFYVSFHDPTNNDDADLQLYWTDEIGNRLIIFNFNLQSGTSPTGKVGSFTTILHSVTNPISILSSGTFGDPTLVYDLYVTVEEL